MPWLSIRAKPLGLLLAVPGLLIALEFAVPAWRNHIPLSTAPVFSLPMARDAMRNPVAFQKAIDVYHADRGAKIELAGPDKTSLTVFYFEWDNVEDHPKMKDRRKRDFYGHNSEYCNIHAGFTLQSHNADRIFKSPGQPALVFNATTYADPAKQPVYVYKITWVQGLGSLQVRDRDERYARLKYAFDRGRGAARIIDCGIFGAQDESHAWQIFQTQVVQHLAWSAPQLET